MYCNPTIKQKHIDKVDCLIQKNYGMLDTLIRDI